MNQKNEHAQIYQERNRVVAVLAKLAQGQGMKAWLDRQQGNDVDEGWAWVVYIELPTGQVSWHIHDSELPWFGFLPRQNEPGHPSWDGHTTEEKYARCLAYCHLKL